jgi:2-hydroxychromene-2-carboxylate isomerase
MNHTIKYFHDFGSPFSYLGSTQVEAFCERLGVELLWRPMVLGAVFKTIGQDNVPMSSMSAPKQTLYFTDMHRFAKHYGIPFDFPEKFPMRTIAALRLVIAAAETSALAGAKLTHRIYRAYWADGEDISDPSILGRLCGAVGLDGEALIARTGEPDLKKVLFAYTDEAVEAGVFGAPSYLVDDKELFWGQDRLPLVEHYLNTNGS